MHVDMHISALQHYDPFINTVDTFLRMQDESEIYI